MPLFDGNGGFFKKVGNAAESIFKVPGKIIDFGQNLGNKVFNTAEGVSRTGRSEGRQFFAGQAGSNIATSLTNLISNNMNIIVIGVILFVIFRKK